MDCVNGFDTLSFRSTPPFSPPISSSSSSPSRQPFLIGVAGGTASGKTSVCKKIVEFLEQSSPICGQRVVTIGQDSFYKNLNRQEIDRAVLGEYNFDHPDAFDMPLMIESLRSMLDCKPVEIPVYNFKTHSRCLETRQILTADVVLFEGILVLYDPGVRALMHMKVFVDTDSDTRLSRRVLRDIQERGRNLEQVLDQYINVVKPAFEEFTLPTKKYADVIIPRGAENIVAIDLIGQHIRDILAGKIDVTRPVRKRTRRQSDSLLARPH